MIKLPSRKNYQSFISWIYEKANILDISYDDYVTISIESNTDFRDKIISKLKEFDGIVIF